MTVSMWPYGGISETLEHRLTVLSGMIERPEMSDAPLKDSAAGTSGKFRRGILTEKAERFKKQRLLPAGHITQVM